MPKTVKKDYSGRAGGAALLQERAHYAEILQERHHVAR
jgi:hypothetical protein